MHLHTHTQINVRAKENATLLRPFCELILKLHNITIHGMRECRKAASVESMKL